MHQTQFPAKKNDPQYIASKAANTKTPNFYIPSKGI